MPIVELKKTWDFLRFYRQVTWYIPEILADSQPALHNHQDLLDIIKLLKEKFNVSRSVLTKEYFSKYGMDGQSDTTNQHRAFDLAMKVLIMVESSSDNQSWHMCQIQSPGAATNHCVSSCSQRFRLGNLTAKHSADNLPRKGWLERISNSREQITSVGTSY